MTQPVWEMGCTAMAISRSVAERKAMRATPRDDGRSWKRRSGASLRKAARINGAGFSAAVSGNRETKEKRAALSQSPSRTQTSTCVGLSSRSSLSTSSSSSSPTLPSTSLSEGETSSEAAVSGGATPCCHERRGGT
jgi:hypothetical protein